MLESIAGHRGRRLAQLTAALAAAALALGIAAVTGFAADPIVEASNAPLAWNPNTVEVASGNSVAFKNDSATLHGVVWDSAPVAPNCTNVPSEGKMNWTGSCSFQQSGTYLFHCPVHPLQMKGEVKVPGNTAPVVTSEPATAIGETGATLKGKVNPSGRPTKYFFEYGTANTYGAKTDEEDAGEGSAAVAKEETVTGLTPATVYHFRLVAKSDAGTTLGPDREFTTTGPPSATTEAATKVGGTEATLMGSVDPHGVTTTYYFNYGETTAYGQETGKTSVGTVKPTGPVSVPVTGLTPKKTYHFQLVAESAAGTVFGADKTFTTLGEPVAVTGAATAIGQTGATLQGTVNPQGQQTTYVFRYGTTTAYGQETTVQSAGKGLAAVAASGAVSGLSAGTTYHFQMVAQNPSGTTAGSDQAFTTSTAPPPTPPSSPSPPAQSPPAPPTPPDTKLTSKPPAKTKDRTPTVKFTATAAGATYRCSVDGKPFKACRSPFTSPALKPGRHTIRVAALAGGATDPTPASCSFKVVAKRKARR